MGALGSREEIVIGPGPSGGIGSASDPLAQQRTEETYHRMENTIFQEGYRQGVAATTARFSEGAELSVRSAFSRSLAEEEGRRAAELESSIAALRKAQYRCDGAPCFNSLRPSPPKPHLHSPRSSLPPPTATLSRPCAARAERPKNHLSARWKRRQCWPATLPRTAPLLLTRTSSAPTLQWTQK
jgi:hypothetical protein